MRLRNGFTMAGLAVVIIVGLQGSITARGDVIYEQDFSTAASGTNDPAGWTDINDNWGISNGEYRCNQPSVASKTALAYCNTATNWTDYSVTIDYRFAQKTYAGLIGRVANEGTFYHLRYNSLNDLLQLYKFVNGSVVWTEESSVAVDISDGTPLLMRMTFDGTEVTGELTSSTDSAFGSVMLTVSRDDASGVIASGGVGVRNFANNGSVAVVDNLVVNSIPEPVSLSLLAVGGLGVLLRRKA